MWNRPDSRAAEERRLRIGRNGCRAAGIRRVAITGLRTPEILPCAEEQYRLRSRRLDEPGRVRADSRPPAEHAEIEGLEMREALVRPLDGHHRIPGLELIALVQRAHR